MSAPHRSLLDRYFPRAYRTVRLSDDGFVLSTAVGFGRWRDQDVRWAEIERIDAGRRPNLPVGDAYLLFVLPSGDEVLVGDDMPEFKALLDALFARRPEIESQWTSVNTGPVNEPDLRTIWTRKHEIR